MRRPWSGSLVGCTYALAVALANPSQSAAADPAPAKPPAHTLGVIPFYSPERMWQLYMPFIEYLRQQTGEPWELKLFANHETMVEGVCKGAVDVSLLGPVPLARVNRTCAVTPFLIPNGKDGKPTYRAMLLTADPAVATIAALRGKKIGFFKGSTAAHVLPVKLLRDAGLGPGSYEAVFLESQDRIMTALLAHDISGAGVKEALYRRFEKEPVRLLQASGDLPNFAFCALPSQPPAKRERFVKTLLTLQPLEKAADADTVKVWDDEIRNGFALPTPEFLPAVRKTLEIYDAVMNEKP